MNSPIPVTILTGFLGSGKTTLLNRILHERHGLRIAVIENEFGEIGVDQDLVINADEEILEMNNGCICCTVRGDLIRILSDLIARGKPIDRVIIETTGLAEPGPVAQTFFIDPAIAENFYLDGIITLVDCKHILQQLNNSEEASAQIAFADLIVLNKLDVATDEQVAAAEQRVSSINGMAHIYKTTLAAAPIDELLDVGGFNLDRALANKPSFLEPEYPFEWGGIYTLPKQCQLVLNSGPDTSLAFLCLPVPLVSEEALLTAADHALLEFSRAQHVISAGQALKRELGVHQLQLAGSEEFRFPVDIGSPGVYAIFTQHGPEEFNLSIEGPSGPLVPLLSHVFNSEHQHDETVGSIAIELDEPLDGDRLERVLDFLLRTQGQNIYRMKGILNVAGETQRYIFQAVHMLFEGKWGKEWGDAPRHSRMVVIGKHLPRDEITTLLNLCRISQVASEVALA